jgi:sugar fermentation stimulation protein A
MRICWRFSVQRKSALVKLGPLISGRFLHRDNRFRVQVEVGGRVEPAHLPNSGRLGELLVRGRKVWLTRADLEHSPHRRTAYDLTLVAHAGRLVSVDTRIPGKLVAAALHQGRLAGFESYAVVEHEVRLGESRLDFRLAGKAEIPPCWIEVKSVTLVQEGTALFPDAPTLRGQRHVRELLNVVAKGDRAALVFVVQRDDALRFAPHSEADPGFAQALREAAQAGVEVYAWRCHVSRQAIQLLDAIPTVLTADPGR